MTDRSREQPIIPDITPDAADPGEGVHGARGSRPLVTPPARTTGDRRGR